MSTRLTVIIGTRNREVPLRQTLECLEAQWCEGVEVLVVDGASTDGTVAMVEQLAARRPWLRLLRLEANGGFDKDYDLAVGAAHGDWCWLFTDDDLLAPGALTHVLRALEADHDLVVVNAEVRDSDCESVLRARQLPFAEDRVYAPGDPALLADLGALLTFVGAVVIRRSLWLARERARYHGSLFVHAGVIFQASLPGTALAIAEPLVRIRYGVGGWTTRRAQIWLFLWPELVWSFSGYPAAARAAVSPREPWRQPHRLLALRAVGAIDRAFYEQRLRSRMNGRQRLLAQLCVSTPVPLANALLRFAHRLLRRPGSDIALFDLRQARQAS